MLHLQTGVDLDEVVLAVLVHQELHGARVLVAHLRAAPEAGRSDDESLTGTALPTGWFHKRTDARKLTGSAHWGAKRPERTAPQDPARSLIRLRPARLGKLSDPPRSRASSCLARAPPTQTRASSGRLFSEGLQKVTSSLLHHHLWPLTKDMPFERSQQMMILTQNSALIPVSL